MSDKRATDEIRCIDCGFFNAYERRNDGVWELYCPDCGSVFGVDNLPKECGDCKKRLRDLADMGRGLCVSCHVGRWAPEKKAAISKLIGMAFKSPKPTDAEKDAAIDEAFKNMD